MDTDQRRYPRLQVDLPVQRQSATGTVSERIVSLSAAGLGLATREFLRPGARVDLVIEGCAASGAQPIPVHTEVQHLRTAGKPAPYLAGLKLLDPASEKAPSVHSLLLALLAAPDGVRAARRLEVHAQATWTPDYPGTEQLVDLANISRGGALLQGDLATEPGTPGTLTLLNVAKRPSVSLRARVAWSRRSFPLDCAGLSFETNERTRGTVDQLLRWFAFTPCILDTSGSRVGTFVRVGAFELEGLLARGGMCDVYRGRGVERPFSNLAVALKRMRPEALSQPGLVDRFLTEADLGRMLAHPNLVRVYSTFEFDEEYWTAMDLVEGPSLEKVLTRCANRGERPPVRAVLAMADELLSALDYCHHFELSPGRTIEVVHGDVTPSNVLIDREGMVRLIDFGVATTGLLDADLGGVAGKLSYIAPELFLSTERPTAAVDIYQAGIVLYEALTGTKPFRGKSPDEMVAAVRQGPARPATLNPEVPAAVEEAVLRALALDPRKRPASAGEFARLLASSGQCPTGTAVGEQLKALVALAEAKR